MKYLFIKNIVFLSAIFNVYPIFITNLIQAALMVSSSVASTVPLLAESPAVLISSTPVYTRWSSTNAVSAITHQLSVVPEPAAANSISPRLVIVLLHRLLELRDACFADFGEAFIAREYCVLKLESLLTAAASTEAAHCFQIVTMHIDPACVRVYPTAACSSASMTALELNHLRTDNDHYKSRISNCFSAVDDMRLWLATAQFPIPPAALESHCGVQNQYLGPQRFLVGRFDCLNNDSTTILASAQDSRSTLRRVLGLLLEAFRASPNNYDTCDDVPESLST